MPNQDELNYLKSQLEYLDGDKSTFPTAIYVRKSKFDTKETSLPAQIEKCKEEIDSCPMLELITYQNGIFQDEDKSGMFTRKRTGYQDMLKLVEAGLIKVVVVYHSDRLTRRLSTKEEFIENIESKGGLVISATESLKRNASGKLSMRVMGAVSQYHAENTAELCMRTNTTRNAPECKSSGGVCNYGYKFTATRKMEINEEEAPAVRLMFQMFTEHKSYQEIIKALDAQGYKTRAGKSFVQTTIMSILKNVKYTGTYTYNIKGGKKKKERVLVQTFDEVRVVNGIPRLVDNETFEKAQEILKNRRLSDGKTPIPDSGYLLTGLLFCSDCGASWHGASKVAGHQHKKYYNYVCSTFDNPKEDKKCSQVPINRDTLEKAVAHVLSKMTSELIAKTDVFKMLEHRITQQLQRTIEDYKRSSTLTEEKKAKIMATWINVTDEEIKADFEAKYKKCNELLKQYSTSIEKAEKQLKGLKKKLKSFKQTFTGFSAQTLLTNRHLFAALARRFIKRINVGDEIVIELVDLN